MKLRLLAGPFALAGCLSAFAAAPNALWIQAQPQDDVETALQAAATGSSFDAPAARAEQLLQLSRQAPGSAASGLAQLAAGLILLEADKPADAVAPLRHPDLARTAVPELALLALGRALDRTKDAAGAVQAYLAAAERRSDASTRCPALLEAADVLQRAAQPERAVQLLQRALGPCERRSTLLALAKAQEVKRDLRAAAASYDTLDSESPASAEAREAAPRLRALAAYLAPLSPEERAARDLKKGQALLEAGRASEAAGVLRAIPVARLSAGENDLVRARLGRAFLASGRLREAELALSSVRAGSAYEAEAAYSLARIGQRRADRVDAYEAVAARFPGSEWAEEALLALANHYQKDARDEEALPYYRRLLEEFPEGRYYERASWRVGWGDYRAGRFEQAAQVMEKTARLRPRANVTPGLLYWSGRARKELGQLERARALLDETYRRYKHAYHGIRAREALGQLPPGPLAPPPEALEPAPGRDGAAGLGPEARERVRQLLLIARWEEAEDELRAAPASPRVGATIAWLESRRGRLRPAIVQLKRAYPDYIGEGGDGLPPEAWRILYPLEYADVLRAKAVERGLDPALVAALVCQESTFDSDAISSAGARGLMQIMPPTGRTLARALGQSYQRSLLHRPETSLDFGTHYLKQLIDQFDGRVERALAAYNAGPHRVHAWTAGRPEMPAEEFIESIPFTETRFYVMAILATQEQYRRIYDLSAEVASSAGRARPRGGD